MNLNYKVEGSICNQKQETRNQKRINLIDPQNMAVYIIELKDVPFFAFHGVHEEERRTGNEFLVNLSAEISPDVEKISSIKETVNYVSLFEIVKMEMMQPVSLLETLINNIIDRVHAAFPEINRIRVTIDKLNPLISFFSGRVSVTCEKKF